MNEVSGTTSANKQEILDAEREWADAVMRKDTVAANIILADEFRLTGPELQRLSTGRAATKEVWMQTLPLIDTKSFDFSDMQVTVFGSAAVAFVHATLDWSIQGRPLPSHYRLTDLWVNREGRWQVLTRVSEPLD
jgi:ketosteroid isomerase-like protein